jgi:glucosamine--fructose-6-phosphate aminotransferase (isomerizing)
MTLLTMCGLIGVIGQNAQSKIISGLQSMQYRGYDSWGMAIVNGQELDIYKSTGIVNEVDLQQNQSNIGIGHTRWATHGTVTTTNAHPIAYKHLAVVHNGIIENYSSIRKQFRDFPWHTDTDTECILAILANSDLNINQLSKVLDLLEGSFAFIILSEKTTDKLYFARKGITPLFINIDPESHSISSTLFNYNPNTRYIEVQDGQCGILSSNELVISPDTPKYIELKLDNKMVGKTHSTWFESEFRSQPDILENALQSVYPADIPRPTGHIYLSGCGSAYIAGLIGQYWLHKAGFSAQTCYPSELPVHVDYLLTISQSGETADTLKALMKAKTGVAIINNELSTMGLRANYKIPVLAGTEISVASTKATTAQMLAILRFVQNLGLEVNLESIPNLMRHFINNVLDKVDEIAKRISTARNLLILGRQELYPIALEAALKIKELAYIHAEGMCAPELKHGPLALIDSESIVICLCPNYDNAPAEIIARGGSVIVFTPYPELFPGAVTITVDIVDDIFTPFLYILPMQWLAYKLCMIKGNSIDMPRNLAKSVTVG